MPLTSVAPLIPVTAVPRHLATAEGCFQGWPRPPESLSRALQVELTKMPMQKRYKRNLGACRMRAFSVDVKIFNIFLIITNVSFPRSGLGGEEPSLRHLVPLGAAQPPTGKALHGVGPPRVHQPITPLSPVSATQGDPAQHTRQFCKARRQ